MKTRQQLIAEPEEPDLLGRAGRRRQVEQMARATRWLTRELVAQAMGKLGQALDPTAEATGLSDQGIASTSAAGSEASREELSQVSGMPVGNEPEAQDGGAASSIKVQTSSVDVAAQQGCKVNTDFRVSGATPERRARFQRVLRLPDVKPPCWTCRA